MRSLSRPHQTETTEAGAETPRPRLRSRSLATAAAALAATAAAVTASTGTAHAQSQAYQLTSGNLVYLQNFDSLNNGSGQFLFTPGNPATNPPNSLIGWYSTESKYTATDGSSGKGLYSFGTTGSTDRALGLVSQGAAAAVNLTTYGMKVQNTTGGTIAGVYVSYTGEQWRNGNDSLPASLDFQFLITSSNLDSNINGGVAGYTTASGLTFTAPRTTLNAPSNSTLDGNLAANRQTFSNVYVDFTSVGGLKNGDYVWLRWTQGNVNGSGVSLGVDDVGFSFQPVPAPPPVVSLGIGGGVMGLLNLSMVRIRRRRRPAAAKSDAE